MMQLRIAFKSFSVQSGHNGPWTFIHVDDLFYLYDCEKVNKGSAYRILFKGGFGMAYLYDINNISEEL